MSKDIMIDLSYHNEIEHDIFNLCTRGEMDDMHIKTIVGELSHKTKLSLEKLSSTMNIAIVLRVIITHFEIND